MKEELSNIIFEKFPQLFVDHNKYFKETNRELFESDPTFAKLFHEICDFKIHFGNGWFKIFYDFCKEIAEFKGVYFEQCKKDKLGKPYISYGGITSDNCEHIFNLTCEFENKAITICEECGESDENRHPKILCEKCYG